MERKTIKNILDFLNTKENKKLPKKWFDSIEKLKLIKELENHPDDIQYKYDGFLLLSKTNITKLPNDLRVENGSLDLVDCKQLTELPDNLYVEYGLYLNKTNIEKLPNNLYVGGTLSIKDTPLADNYTDEEIEDIVTSTGGDIIGLILR
jgi:hypothetical protein